MPTGSSSTRTLSGSEIEKLRCSEDGYRISLYRSWKVLSLVKNDVAGSQRSGNPLLRKRGVVSQAQGAYFGLAATASFGGLDFSFGIDALPSRSIAWPTPANASESGSIPRTTRRRPWSSGDTEDSCPPQHLRSKATNSSRYSRDRSGGARRSFGQRSATFSAASARSSRRWICAASRLPF